MKKRLLVSVLMGAILGVVCIIGAQVRYDVDLGGWYLFSFWFNRVLIGVVIGLLVTEKNPLKLLVRGLVVGLFVSFAFYLKHQESSFFKDIRNIISGG